MKIKILGLSLLAANLASLAPAQELPAYLEAVPLTFLWHRTHDTMTSSKLADPDVTTEPTQNVEPVERVTTETARTRRDTPPGNQGFFVEQLQQVFAFSTGFDFEIVAVRDPARNVQELVTNPYRIYISANPRALGRLYPFPGFDSFIVDPYVPLVPSYPIPTGLTLSLGPALGNHVESYDANGNLTNVTGNIATTFELKYASHFRVNIDSEMPFHQYHLVATGTANFPIRRLTASRNGIPVVLAPGPMKIRGIGTFDHRYYASPTDNYYFAGLSSVTLTMGKAKLVARERFIAPPEPEDPEDDEEEGGGGNITAPGLGGGS